MDKVYEQQFKRSRVDAGPGGKEKEKGEKSSWGSLAPLRSDPPSEDGAKKKRGPPQREYPPLPFSLRYSTGVEIGKENTLYLFGNNGIPAAFCGRVWTIETMNC